MLSGKSRALALLMLVAMLMSSMFTVAFAKDDTGEGTKTDYVGYIEENTIANSAGVSFTQAWMRNYLTDNKEKSESSAPYCTIKMGEESKDLYIIKGKTVEQFEAQVDKALVNAATVDDVSNITDGLNIGADTGGATALLSGFAPIISLVVGVIVVLVTMGMTLFSAFDIAYIAFPVFRNKCEDAKMQGQGAMVKKGNNGESALRFVTDDAQYAVTQGNIESGKSPWAIYFRKRVMSYILLAIILFILLTGNISLITNIALKVVSGIMNVLGGLA